MKLTTERLMELYTEMGEEITEVGFENYGELVETRGIDVDRVLVPFAMQLYFAKNPDVRPQEWVSCFCESFLFGWDIALRQLGRMVFEDAPDE